MILLLNGNARWLWGFVPEILWKSFLARRGDEFIKIFGVTLLAGERPTFALFVIYGFTFDQVGHRRPETIALFSIPRKGTARNLMEHEMLRVSTMDIVHVSDFKRDYV